MGKLKRRSEGWDDTENRVEDRKLKTELRSCPVSVSSWTSDLGPRSNLEMDGALAWLQAIVDIAWRDPYVQAVDRAFLRLARGPSDASNLS